MFHIFISYRRSDASDAVGRIYDYLEKCFGRNVLFKDVDAINAGEDFQESITAAINQCQVMLVIIGRSWLWTSDKSGQRRLDNPADWVRFEIKTALEKDILVMPVLLGNVSMPSRHELPDVLKPLAERNAAYIRQDPDFRRDINRLIRTIQRYFDSLSESTSSLGLGHQNKSSSEAYRVQKTVSDPYRQDGSHSHRKNIPTTDIAIDSSKAKQAHRVRRSLGLPTFRKGLPVSTLSKYVSRRKALQLLTVTGGSAFSILVGKNILSSPRDWELPKVADAYTRGNIARFNVATVNVEEKTIELKSRRARFYSETLGTETTLDLMFLPEGSFMMGSLSQDGKSEELPRHSVTVKSFLMGKHLVTQAQWRAVSTFPKVEREMKPTPSSLSGSNLPVEQVSWDEAVEFCNRLSQYSEKEYRLPSEAEWEYACRAGTTTEFHCGETITSDLANYDAELTYKYGPQGVYRDRTTVVDKFPANSFGLYDMHGNVAEWCQDQWHDSYENAPDDGSTWITQNESSERIIRGGAFPFDPAYCRSAARNKAERDTATLFYGFRVACSSV